MWKVSTGQLLKKLQIHDNIEVIWIFFILLKNNIKGDYNLLFF